MWRAGAEEDTRDRGRLPRPGGAHAALAPRKPGQLSILMRSSPVPQQQGFPGSSLSSGLPPEPRHSERRGEERPVPRTHPSRHPPPPLLGLGGRTRWGGGAQAGSSCHSRTRTHAGGMQTAGLPCGHVSAPPTEVGAQVPSLWALGARQAADERRCRLTLSWPHPSLLPPRLLGGR